MAEPGLSTTSRAATGDGRRFVALRSEPAADPIGREPRATCAAIRMCHSCHCTPARRSGSPHRCMFPEALAARRAVGSELRQSRQNSERDMPVCGSLRRAQVSPAPRSRASHRPRRTESLVARTCSRRTAAATRSAGSTRDSPGSAGTATAREGRVPIAGALPACVASSSRLTPSRRVIAARDARRHPRLRRMTRAHASGARRLGARSGAAAVPRRQRLRRDAPQGSTIARRGRDGARHDERHATTRATPTHLSSRKSLGGPRHCDPIGCRAARSLPIARRTSGLLDGSSVYSVAAAHLSGARPNLMHPRAVLLSSAICAAWVRSRRPRADVADPCLRPAAPMVGLARQRRCAAALDGSRKSRGRSASLRGSAPG